MKTKPALWILALALGIGGLLALVWLRPFAPVSLPEVATPAPAPAEAVPPPPPGAAPAPARAAAVPAPAPEDELLMSDPTEALLAEQIALIQQDPVLRERARQQALAAEADARWHEAVDEAGYTAEDLDPAVLDLFKGLMLEPLYAEGGRIEGLVIEKLKPDHPLARAGFRAGDRIDRIQGTPLRDPADLPGLLASLGGPIEFCVVREDGSEHCTEVVPE